MMIDLPESLQLYTLAYLSSLDQLEILRANRNLFPLWRKVRIIKVDQSFFLSSQSQKREIIAKVENPYNQLDLFFYYRSFDGVSDDVILTSWTFQSLRVLHMYLKDVLLVLQNSPLKKLQHLMILYQNRNNNDDLEQFEKAFELLAIKNQSEGLELKMLSIIGDLRFGSARSNHVGITKLTAIPNLLKLSFGLCKFNSLEWLSAFNTLTHFKLIHCLLPADIKYVDRIKHVILKQCSGITDVSSLNNNYEIGIKSKTITDYSKSFKSSKKIFLHCIEPVVHVNLMDYPHASFISLSNFIHFELATQFSSNLTQLHLDGIGCETLILPQHRLKHLTISSCRLLTTLNGIENISYIELSDLERLTLIGHVNHGNRTFKIAHCSTLRDLRCLHYCETVALAGTMFLKEPLYIPQVKYLEIHGFYVGDFFTSNEIQSFPELIHLSFSGVLTDLKGKTFPKLEELEVQLNFFQRGKMLDESTFPNLKKIMIVTRENHSLEKKKSLCESGFLPMANFQVERRIGESSTVTFLRCLPTIGEK